MALYSYFDKLLVLIIFLTPKLMDSLHIIRIWWAQFLINEKSIYQVNRHVQIILTWSPAFFTRSYLTWAKGVSFHSLFLVHITLVLAHSPILVYPFWSLGTGRTNWRHWFVLILIFAPLSMFSVDMTFTIQGGLSSSSSLPIWWISDRVKIVLGEDGIRNASAPLSTPRHIASRVWLCEEEGG